MKILKQIQDDYCGNFTACPICRGHIDLIAQDMHRHKYYHCMEGGCGIFRFSDNDMGQSKVSVELVDNLFIVI